ncbi:cytochrome P450 [Mycena belliarum]|uniref:Cytochrome P450 n=1 Tax=Mycena belliarum TaxID=1033014 RepID=A0AAD6TZB7_9AGAR|nr:cytochrome P450 [Mycena belliae]
MNTGGVNLPPGPRGLPFLGNVHQVPKTNMWTTFSDWASIYGNIISLPVRDIFYFRIIGRHFIVLSTAEAANELLVKRSSIYSDRPRFVMAGRLIGRETSLIFSSYGPRLRQCRRMLHSALNPQVCYTYNALLTNEAQLFVDSLVACQGPVDPSTYIRRFAGRTLIHIAYGSFTDAEGELLINLAHELALLTDQAVEPGRWLVDSFPFLRHIPSWFPGASFQKWAQYARVRNTATLHLPVQLVKKKMVRSFENQVAGTATTSFTSKLISDMTVDGHLLLPVSMQTAAVLELFFLMMALHPDIQHKAQSEIDSLIGPGLSPGFEHRSALPYVELIIKELYRYHPVAPLVPHATTQADVYRGRHIPRGTGVFVNIWSICHETRVYPHPERFWPERYLEASKSSSSYPGTNPDPAQWAFGFGRRICPGQCLADSMVYICIVKTLAAFQIGKATIRKPLVVV